MLITDISSNLVKLLAQSKLTRAKSQFDKLKATSADQKEKIASLKSEVASLQTQLAASGGAAAEAAKEVLEFPSEDREALQQELAEARMAYSQVIDLGGGQRKRMFHLFRIWCDISHFLFCDITLSRPNNQFVSFGIHDVKSDCGALC